MIAAVILKKRMFKISFMREKAQAENSRSNLEIRAKLKLAFENCFLKHYSRVFYELTYCNKV
jgi:hypothetical protein